MTPLALAIGQIVRAPDFEYIDALGALEIMDPKTDSGMTLDDDDADDSPKVDGLLPEEILWIMDQLLAREVPQRPCHFKLTKDILASWKSAGADGVYVHLPLVVSHELSWLSRLSDVSTQSAAIGADV